MSIPYRSKLSTKLFAPLIVIFAVTIGLLLYLVPKITLNSATESAITSAESTVRQYKAIRGYYTNNVIKKVIAGSDMRGHFNHKDDPTKIPLPATFIHDISTQLSKEGIASLSLYSKFPFPNRNSRQLDEFGESAWAALKSNPTSTYARSEIIDGKHVVRVALADTMTQEGCVNCHNSHTASPKTDWKLGDVRGILEVKIPIEEQFSAASNLSYSIAGVVITVLLVVITVLFYLFRQLISARLREVRLALLKIADGNGNLTNRLHTHPEDEIGQIAQAFNKFMGQMEESISSIGDQVNQLTGTTGKMNEIANSSKRGASKQQEETSMVATAVTEMTSTSEEMAELARGTLDHSKETLSQSEKGRNTVSDNMTSVESLASTMNHASSTVAELENNSQEIGGVLDVIRGIAEQTNLLALNAAIEAARAGEQGRGFAVVADEVRSLAGRTQESTEEINKMIEQLQNGAKSAVEAINSGTSSIDSSLEKAKQTNEMIDGITDAISSIQDLNAQMANAAQEQTSTSDSISRSINSISDISSSTLDDTVALQEMAEEINQSVQRINEQLKRYSN